jgi:hypothetical protein
MSSPCSKLPSKKGSRKLCQDGRMFLNVYFVEGTKWIYDFILQTHTHLPRIGETIEDDNVYYKVTNVVWNTRERLPDILVEHAGTTIRWYDE